MATFINNIAYSWAMVMLRIGANSNMAKGDTAANPIFVDATAIKWSTERKVESIYGLGGQPRKRGFGNVTYEASITLPYGSQIALRQLSPNGTLLGLGEFDVQVTWTNDLAEDISTEAITLSGCIFTESGMDVSQDDTSITKEFNLHPHRIFNATMQPGATDPTWSFELYGGL